MESCEGAGKGGKVMADYKPQTSREMLSKGYSRAETRHPGEPSKCNKCGAEIEWWISPQKKSICFDPCPSDDRDRVCHWTTCPEMNRKPQEKVRASSPAADRAAMKDIQRIIVAEYQRECEGDMHFMDPEHKANWLYKKLSEARFKLFKEGESNGN